MFFRVFPLKKTLFLKTRKCRILARKNAVLAYLSMRGALFFAFIDFAYSISKIRLATGNIVPVRIPVDTFVSAETSPATDGASVAPTSPARASIANISVPPPSRLSPANARVPGHIIPTLNPQSETPISDNAGMGESTVRRYEKASVPLHTTSVFERGICCL